jgi:hypothetical protein
MTGRTRTKLRRALAVFGLLSLLARFAPHRGVHAAEHATDDPPLCQQAIAAKPEKPPLDALAAAEQDAAMRASRAGREAAKQMRAHIGDGPQGALGASDTAERLLRQQADARREGKVLCHCRQRRGDPDREDCEFLYPEKL